MKQHAPPSPVVFIVCILTLAATSVCSQTYVVSGTVYDAVNGQPLAAANIRIDGTSRGTISNAQGQYRLSLDIGSYRLIFSFIGYRTDTLNIVVDRNVQRDVYLQPVPIQLAEVVVTDEDPAIRIMRKVIENKRLWIEALRSYRFEAFTRRVMRRDTAIASIAESYTTGYWQRGDTLREIVKQRRQTANLPLGFLPPGVESIVNFYDDEIRLAGFRFVGPTAQEAFDYYDFKLLQTREAENRPLYVIQMLPKSRVTPLFRGTLTIAGDSYAVAGVEVTPNEVFTFPLISDFQFQYAQQFALYERRFWMPIDIRVRGRVTVSVAGVSIPPIGIEQISSIYDYAINVQLPDTLFQKPRLITTKESEKFDSTFWAQHEVLPLTLEEKIAYEKLDSSQTLQRQFRASGPLASLASFSSSAFRFVDVRYNRVEGLFLGAAYERDSVIALLKGWIGLGYGWSDRRWKGKGGLEFPIDSHRQWSAGAEYFDGIDNVPDENMYSAFAISLMSLLNKIDYRDYYYTRGWRLFGAVRFVSGLTLRLGYRNERHTSAAMTTNFSLFSRSQTFRLNPAVNEGQLRSLSLLLRYGEGEPILLGLFPQNFIELEGEYSSPSLLSSNFHFARLIGRAEINVQTYSRRLFFAPTLYVRLAAGISNGTLPPQRIFVLESRASGTGFFGSLRTANPRQYGGNAFVMLSLEHNFRSTPFLALNIPFLYKNSIELLVHGSIAQAWNQAPAIDLPVPTNGWYYEAGIGLGRLLGLFRIDVTQRLSHARTTFVTIGISRIL